MSEDEQIAALQAVIAKVRQWNDHDTGTPTFFDLHAILASASSGVLDRLKREAAADALEDAALTLPLWPEDRMILRDRAARIRTGATS